MELQGETPGELSAGVMLLIRPEGVNTYFLRKWDLSFTSLRASPEYPRIRGSSRDPSTSVAAATFAQDDKTAMLFCQFFVCFCEGVHGEFQIVSGMRSGDLCADTRGAVRHYRIKKADDVNAFV